MGAVLRLSASVTQVLLYCTSRVVVALWSCSKRRQRKGIRQMRSSLMGLALAVSIIVLVTPISPAGEAARVPRQSPRANARLILIVVMDGLRPDSINLEDTPTLFRLRQEGVSYINSHSVFPTVTRVNAAAISTV